MFEQSLSGCVSLFCSIPMKLSVIGPRDLFMCKAKYHTVFLSQPRLVRHRDRMLVGEAGPNAPVRENSDMGSC